MNRITGFFRKLNISRRIFLVTALCVLLFTTALLLAAGRMATSRIEHTFFSNTEAIEDEMAKGIELFVSDINMLSINLTRNKSMYEIFNDAGLAHEEKEARFRELLDRQLDWSLIGDVAVVDNNGDVYTTGKTPGFDGRPDAHTLYEMDRSDALLRIDCRRAGEQDAAYLSFGRTYRYDTPSKLMGKLFVYVPESKLYDAFEDTEADSGRALVITGDGLVLSGRDKDKIGTTLFDTGFLEQDGFQYTYLPFEGGECIFALKDVRNLRDTLDCDLRTLMIIPRAGLYHSIRQLNIIVISVAAGVLLLTLLLSYLISRRVVRPIHRLQDKLNDFGSGEELTPVYLENSGDELRELEETYNRMIERITDLVKTNIEDKIEQRKLQLIALQAQINPHFLYNTLDTIVWIAKIKKQKEIEDLAMALAGFFRISLHKGDKYMHVREEIEFVRNFVLIQQTRFPGKFEIVYDVDEDILECKVLKIMIQPFVENAIKHGIGPKAALGHIRVSGRKENEDLVFEILDDGVGFTEESRNARGESDGLHGYGVQNVDERIRLEYGAGYGVHMESTPGEGTRVTLRIRCAYFPDPSA